MRIALVAVLLAACELQPAPKQQPAPVIEAAPPPPPADAQIADAPDVDAGPAPIKASADCLRLAAHLVDVVVASATDPAQKTIYEGERMQMTRSLAESCTNEPWSPESQKCYLATKTPAHIKACEKKFPLRPPATGSGAGSAVPPPPPPGATGLRPEPTKGQTTP